MTGMKLESVLHNICLLHLQHMCVFHLQLLLHRIAFVALHEHRVKLQSLAFGSALHTTICQLPLMCQVALHIDDALEGLLPEKAQKGSFTLHQGCSLSGSHIRQITLHL